MSLAAFDRQRAALAIQGTGPEKHVLLVLATRGDEQGRCTPGIARIMADTGLSERTVQRAILALKEAGHITRDERPGCGVVYTVHPRQCDTPAQETPPSERRQTPATVAPKQPRTPIPQKATPSSVKRATPVPSNFIPDPKAGSLTAKAMAAWPPGELEEQIEHFIDHHTSHGTMSKCWQASWRTWVKNWKKFNGSNRQGGSSRPQRGDGFTAALRQAAGL